MQINHIEIISHPNQKSFSSQNKQQMLARTGEAAAAGAPTYTAARMELVQLLWEPGRRSFKKLKRDLQCDSATLPLGTLRVSRDHFPQQYTITT